MPHLEDEEAVVVQVDALALQQLCDLAKVALAVIDVVVGAVVAVRCAGDRELRAGHHLKRLLSLG